MGEWPDNITPLFPEGKIPEELKRQLELRRGIENIRNGVRNGATQTMEEASDYDRTNFEQSIQAIITSGQGGFNEYTWLLRDFNNQVTSDTLADIIAGAQGEYTAGMAWQDFVERNDSSIELMTKDQLVQIAAHTVATLYLEDMLNKLDRIFVSKLTIDDALTLAGSQHEIVASYGAEKLNSLLNQELAKDQPDLTVKEVAAIYDLTSVSDTIKHRIAAIVSPSREEIDAPAQADSAS